MNAIPLHVNGARPQPQPRTLPHNLDAEASVLGGIILQNESLGSLGELEVEDFYDLRHKVVFGAMRHLQARGTPIDIVTLEVAIENAGKIVAVGGAAFLGELALRVPTPDNVIFYAREVALHARRRRAELVLGDAIDRAQRGTYEPDEMLSEIAGELLRIDERRDRHPREEPLGLISIADAYDELELLRGAPIYTTPFPTLNDCIGYGGLLGTQVYTVAAGTGRGKTTWVAAVADHAALTVPVLVASWEMRPGYFVARSAAGQLGMHSNEILRPNTDDPQHLATLRERVLGAMPHVRFHFLHRPSLSRLRRAVEHVTQLYGQPPLLVIDYLQKLADAIARTMPRPDQRAATTEASEALCEIAETSRAAVIAVSSIGRGNNKRAAKPRALEPYELVDIAKESGAVEYDGAGLIVLSLDKETEGNERVATMTIAKSRFGEEVHIDARYNGRRGQWRDLGRLDTTQLPNSGGTGPSTERIRRAIAKALLDLGASSSKDTIAKVAKMRATEIRGEFDLMLAGDEPLIVKQRGQYQLTAAGRSVALDGRPTLEGVQ